MSNKVYALLATGDVVEGVENKSNVTTPKSVRAYYRGRHDTFKPVTSFAHTIENYDHLVALFGEERVPKPDMTNETSLAYLRKHGKAIGKVSDKSNDDARGKGQFFVVELASDDETFFVGNVARSYCVLYDGHLREIKPEPQRPALKAGDYVMGVSSDLDNISSGRYIVVDNGTELVVFDGENTMLPILEQIEMGYFKRIEKE